MFGEMVLTEVKVVLIDRKHFMFLVHQNPFFALQIMTILAERLRCIDEAL